MVLREYDSLQREYLHGVTSASNGQTLYHEATFVDLEGNRTTQLVESYRHYIGTDPSNMQIYGADEGCAYQYDERGNIVFIYNYTTGAEITYEYDSLNQLIRENDLARNTTITYTYDDCGNLLQKSFYNYNQKNKIQVSYLRLP